MKRIYFIVMMLACLAASVASQTIEDTIIALAQEGRELDLEQNRLDSAIDRYKILGQELTNEQKQNNLERTKLQNKVNKMLVEKKKIDRAVKIFDSLCVRRVFYQGEDSAYQSCLNKKKSLEKRIVLYNVDVGAVDVEVAAFNAASMELETRLKAYQVSVDSLSACWDIFQGKQSDIRRRRTAVFNSPEYRQLIADKKIPEKCLELTFRHQYFDLCNCLEEAWKKQ